MKRLFLIFLLILCSYSNIYTNHEKDSLAQLGSSTNVINQGNQINIVVILVLFPVVVAFIFIVFLLYRKRREAYFREVQLQFKLDKSDLEMRALRAQVNPHFIFNCLNSIHHFIHRNESHLAENYLLKFSRLIRLVLENSTYTMVSIEDDLKALELYLEMEQLRLSHSFEYTIDYNNIDINDISIPPLLIQPFVENAIWHGLNSSTKKGRIEINFSMTNDSLRCTIDDNGESQGKKDGDGFKSKSMGLSLIRERLDLHERLYETKYGFVLNDKKNALGNTNGKRVELTLPYK